MGYRGPEAAAGLGFAPRARVARARTRGNCPQKYSARNRLKWYRYSVLKSYGASEKLRIESYAAPITPHRKLRRPRPLPYTPSYPPCASGRHGARSAPQGLSYTTRRQRGWMTPFAAIFRAMRRVFTVLIAHSIVLFYRADRQRRPESSCRRVTRRSNYSR